jgi:dephospho-CoA kinase
LPQKKLLSQKVSLEIVHTPLQIGITGGIGSGKSLVCKIFSALQVPVYDADSRAKAVMTTDGILIESIKKEFGTLAYKRNGELDREYVSKLVFSNPQKLATLNALVHPRVGTDYRQWASTQSAAYVLREAALLIETGASAQVHELLVVEAPEALRIKRVLARDPHRSEEQVREIMKNQLSDSERRKHAQHIIQNDEQHSLVDQVLALHQRFLAQTHA